MLFGFGKKKDKETKDAADLIKHDDDKQQEDSEIAKPYRPSDKDENGENHTALHSPSDSEDKENAEVKGDQQADESNKQVDKPAEDGGDRVIRVDNEALAKLMSKSSKSSTLKITSNKPDGPSEDQTEDEKAVLEAAAADKKPAADKPSTLAETKHSEKPDEVKHDLPQSPAKLEAEKKQKEYQKNASKPAAETKPGELKQNDKPAQSTAPLDQEKGKLNAEKQERAEMLQKPASTVKPAESMSGKETLIAKRSNGGNHRTVSQPKTMLQNVAPVNPMAGNSKNKHDQKAQVSSGISRQAVKPASVSRPSGLTVKREDKQSQNKPSLNPAPKSESEKKILNNSSSIQPRQNPEEKKLDASQKTAAETKPGSPAPKQKKTQAPAPQATQKIASKPAAASKPDLKQAAKPASTPVKKVAQPVLVSFVCNGKKIAKDFAFVGEPGRKLTAKDLPKIPGYAIKHEMIPDIRISVERQKVTIFYEPSTVTYQIIPVGEDLTPIKSTAEYKHYRGRAGSTIDLFPQVKGYRQAEARRYSVPDESGKKIKVVYVPLRQTIRVIRRTTDGEVLSEEHITGKTGESYSVKLDSRHFEGYEIGSVPNNLSGTFQPDGPDVVIEYVPADSSVMVEFVDESGNQIHKPLEEKGKYKSEYAIQPPVIDGYELASDPDMLSGRFTAKQRKIVLSFKPAQVSLTVHYWLDEQKTVQATDDAVVSGLVGDRYLQSTPDIQGMTADKNLVEGIFSAYGNKDVDVIYAPISCTATISLRVPSGEMIEGYEPKVFTGNWGDEFSFELPTISGYEKPETEYRARFSAPVQADSVYYKPLESTVKVRYVNARTKEAISGYPPRVVTGFVGSAYSIDPEIIDGYRLSKVPDSASGIFRTNEQEVDFYYEPSLSELVLHFYDSTLNSLAPNKAIRGYYGEKYQLTTETSLEGYKLTSTSYPLEGTFPPNRQDVDLYFKATPVAFDLIPVDQFGNEIDPKYDIHVMGLMNQTFSERLPEIPGYNALYSSIEDTILPEYAGRRIKLNYQPKDSSITVHCFYKGGNHDGERVFEDETFNGKVGSEFEYPVRDVDGYTANMQLLTTKYRAENQDLTVIYEVRTEDYMIHYKDPNGALVGGMPQANGFYGQAIDVSGNVPRGFHMLSGADSKIYLDGSGVYNVAVNPDELLVDVVPQTADGVSLMSPRQVSGEYHVPQEITLPQIPGFNSTAGETITIPFELGETTLPVVYEPQARKVTVRYISVEGNDIHEPTVVNGRYQERYRIEPLKIDGFFVLKDEAKTGIYGLTDANVTFVYRAGSDEFSRAVTPLSEIISQQNAQSNFHENSQTVVSENPNYQPGENENYLDNNSYEDPNASNYNNTTVQQQPNTQSNPNEYNDSSNDDDFSGSSETHNTQHTAGILDFLNDFEK